MVEEIKITEDAMKLLVFIKKSNQTNSNKILESSGWDNNRVKNAIKFLLKEKFISIKGTRCNGNIWRIECEPKGIIYIENPKDFKKTYGFNINFNFNIDSLVKAEVDKIFDVKLFGL